MSFIMRHIKYTFQRLMTTWYRSMKSFNDPYSVESTLSSERSYRRIFETLTPPYFSDRLDSNSPEVQIKKVSAFLIMHGGDKGFEPKDIPEAPDVSLLDEDEMLLLVVNLPDKGYMKGIQRTFEAWCNFFIAPSGYEKWHMNDKILETEYLALSQGQEYVPGIYWVAFNPLTYVGKSTKDAIVKASMDQRILAGIEVIIAGTLLPQLIDNMNEDEMPLPFMSGYLSKRNEKLYQNTGIPGTFEVPMVSISRRQLRIVLSMSRWDLVEWSHASPTIRML